MVFVTCERLTEEHGNYLYTLLKDRTFTDQASLQKFKTELNVFNQFATVLAMCDFKFCRYQAIRALREVQIKVKRFCESSDFRIERAYEREQQKEGVVEETK
jgi:hypothetical protein